MDGMLGRVLGHYELVARLGGGGMGTVYRGVHQALQQPRAVKILRPDLADEPDVVARFRREAMIAAGLRHPNIVLIYDVAEDDGLYYIVMDLLEGGTLRNVIRSSAPLPAERVVALLKPLASALDYAHGRGVIHRDIKPGNVMVGADDRVTLVDFGIARAAEEARLTRSGTVVGTAEYMAPEAFTSAGSDRGGDLYALGIIAYELFTGQAPFRGNPTAVSYAQVNTAPPPPRSLHAGVPEAIEQVLLRQIAKRPDDRFPDATSFVSALERAAASGGVADAPTIAVTRPVAAPMPPSGQAPQAAPPPAFPRPAPAGQAPTTGAQPPPSSGQTSPPSAHPLSAGAQVPPAGARPPAPGQGPFRPAPPPPPSGQTVRPPMTTPGAPEPGTVILDAGAPPPEHREPSSPPQSATKRIVGFALVVLALVVVGSVAVMQLSGQPETGEPLAQATAAPAATQAVAPTAPPTSPPAAQVTSVPAKPTAPASTSGAIAAAPTPQATQVPAPAAKPSEPTVTPAPAAPTAAAPAAVAAAPTAGPSGPAAAASPPPLVFSNVVLDERFANNQRNWPNDPESTVWLANGFLRLFARVPNRFVSVNAPGIGPYSDVEVSGRFRKAGGPPGGGFGIIVRDQSPQPLDGVFQGGRYYVFEVGEGTQWGIWRRETDHWFEFFDWTESSAIRPPPEWNDLTVRAIGPRITFIVNGVQFAEITDDALASGGRVGIYTAGDGNEVEAQQFVVRTAR